MELIYLWIEKFRNIECKGITFSPRHKILFDYDYERKDGILTIEHNEYDLDRYFYGPKVNNVTAISGINGSGKTNIVDLLGMTMRDRKMKTYDEKNKRYNRYFILYGDEKDNYFIEGVDHELIRNLSEILPGTSTCYSMHVKRSGDLFKCTSYSQHSEDYKKLSYLYIKGSYRQGHNDLNKNEGYDYTTFFYRQVFGEIHQDISFLEKYKVISYLKKRDENIKQLKFSGDIFIKLSWKFDTTISKKYLGNKNLYIKNPDDNYTSIYSSNVDRSKEYKEFFILSFLSDFIHYTYSILIHFMKENNTYFDENKIKNQINKFIDNLHLASNDRIDFFLNVISTLEKMLDSEKNYFNTLDDRLRRQLISHLMDIEDKYFFKNEILLCIDDKLEDSFFKFLSFIDINTDGEYNKILNFFNIDFGPISSGQHVFINVLTAIQAGINLCTKMSSDKLIILLDEPDNSMHPEWSRKLISIILSFLNGMNNINLRYEIIITTHSPFTLSDLPRENVILLDKCEETGTCITKVNDIDDINQTFASNIHTLFAKSFFMKSTIGEFSLSKINEVVKLLKKKTLTKEEKILIENIIKIVGEPLIKYKLKEMYFEKYPKQKKELLEKQLELIKEELREFEEDDTDKE